VFLTEADVLQAIARAKEVRNDYLPLDQRACRICGEPLSFVSASSEGIKYACDRATMEHESGLSPFARERFVHRSESTVWESDYRPDQRVVSVLDDLIRLLEAM
jgi:hypothetical protein